MTNLFPKISIITPSFCQAKYIEETIISIINQNYPNLEYIIIDGGSKDGTIDIIKKHATNIKYWISEPDHGQTDAINKGFKIATGDIINWLNSDDLLAPDSLKAISSCFLKEEVKAMTGAVRNFQEDGIEWNELTPVKSNAIEYISRSFNNQPGTYFRKAIWDKYFPLPVQLKYTMDQYLWFCFWLENTPESFLIAKSTIAHFRRHALSKTSSSLKNTIYNNLGIDFFNEHNLIFWSHFKINDPDKADILSEYFWNDYDYRKNRIIFPEIKKLDSKSNESIFQLYLFELVKEDYKHGFLERSGKNITLLENEFFKKDEWAVISKMKLKIINPALLKGYRTLYWKLRSALRT